MQFAPEANAEDVETTIVLEFEDGEDWSTGT